MMRAFLLSVLTISIFLLLSCGTGKSDRKSDEKNVAADAAITRKNISPH
jgi:hypothetical protein